MTVGAEVVRQGLIKGLVVFRVLPQRKLGVEEVLDLVEFLGADRGRPRWQSAQLAAPPSAMSPCQGVKSCPWSLGTWQRLQLSSPFLPKALKSVAFTGGLAPGILAATSWICFWPSWHDAQKRPIDLGPWGSRLGLGARLGQVVTSESCWWQLSQAAPLAPRAAKCRSWLNTTREVLSGLKVFSISIGGRQVRVGQRPPSRNWPGTTWPFNDAGSGWPFESSSCPLSGFTLTQSQRPPSAATRPRKATNRAQRMNRFTWPPPRRGPGPSPGREP